MKHSIAGLLIALFISCGYTQLDTPEQRDTDPQSIPDLVITDIRSHVSMKTYRRYFGDHYSETPYYEVEFYYHIANVSRVPYKGSPLIGFANGSDDLARHYFPSVVSIEPKLITVLPSDTIVVSAVIRFDQSHPPLGMFRFLLITHNIMRDSPLPFDKMSFPPDERTGNNSFEYYLQ